jgi:hypothetical protein
MDCKTLDEIMASNDSTDNIEYTECVDQHSKSVPSKLLENEPFMFGVIFLAITGVAILLGAYVRRSNKEPNKNDKK